MDILKAATDWAKAEVFSTAFFIVAGVVFIATCIGLWQLGKTDLAKAYIIPTLVAGVLLMTIGVGLMFTNISRISTFEAEHNKDTSAFVQSEIDRVDRTLKEYKNVLIIVPLLIVVAALLVVFMNTPLWRAIGITTIAMLVVILFIDGMAHARIEAYKEQLVLPEHKPES